MRGFLIALVCLIGLGWPGGGGLQAATTVLVGWSELGMWETDGGDSSVYTLMPPYQTIHAQIISSDLLLTNPAGISVTYQAVADASGSINSTSQGKGNFAQFAQALFGMSLGPEEGLAGYSMPGLANRPQAMAFDPAENWFSAIGIPITPYDDQGRKNPYPLMQLVARDTAGNVLATTRVVLPVSDEMDCRKCHASGSSVSARPNAGWVWDTDPVRDTKLNILRNHDDHSQGTAIYSNVLAEVGYNPAGLVATVTRDARPILCLRCHPDNFLPGTGATGMRPLTQLMHMKHAYSIEPASGQPLNLLTNSAACLSCHAGPETLRVRGVHHNTVNPDGSLALQCQNCHGALTDVGRRGRVGWLDEPVCQSCHTGTATQNAGRLRYTTVFDAPGHLRAAVDPTYATQTNQPAAGLATYRFSQGHGGLKCQACHGSQHAELASLQPNDNVQSVQLQGHAGLLADCATCHGTNILAAAGGPHGLHPMDYHFAQSHNNGGSQCTACHGSDFRGTVLTWAQGDRPFGSSGSASFWRGFQIGCYTCHNGPAGADEGSGGLTNSPPAVGVFSATTVAGTPVAIPLPGSDPDGNALDFRVVAPPAHGTVSLDGAVATYHPDPSFVGNDTFTYAAWDGSTDSNLGSVGVVVTPGECALQASALAPLAAYPNKPVPFRALASLSRCLDAITYDWDFGDGSPHAAVANASHTYPVNGDFTWTLVVSAGGATQTVRGVITISPTLGPPLALTISQLDPWTLLLSWPADRIPTSLEIASDPTQPFAWSPYWEAPVPDVDRFTQTMDLLADPQFYRVRRVP